MTERERTFQEFFNPPPYVPTLSDKLWALSLPLMVIVMAVHVWWTG